MIYRRTVITGHNKKGPHAAPFTVFAYLPAQKLFTSCNFAESFCSSSSCIR